MIIFYSNSCESCAGNHALVNIKSLCKKHELEFQERRTIFWDRWEKEAKEIMEINEIKLPFFYDTESGAVLSGYSLTPLDTLERWIKKVKRYNRKYE